MRWFALMLLALLVAVPATGQVFRDDQILMSSGNRLDADVASGDICVNCSGQGGGHVIEDEGTPLPQQPNLNFTGAGVTATDGPGSVTTVTIPGGGGGSGETNTASNLPGDQGVFAQKVGVDLQFKSLSEGANIQLIPTGDTIAIHNQLLGDVVGPAGAVDSSAVCFDQTTGKLIKECPPGIGASAVLWTDEATLGISQTIDGTWSLIEADTTEEFDPTGEWTTNIQDGSICYSGNDTFVIGFWVTLSIVRGGGGGTEVLSFQVAEATTGAAPNPSTDRVGPVFDMTWDKDTAEMVSITTVASVQTNTCLGLAVQSTGNRSYTVMGTEVILIPIVDSVAGGAGGGDVNGPALSVDQNVALFSGTSGKILREPASSPSANDCIVYTGGVADWAPCPGGGGGGLVTFPVSIGNPVTGCYQNRFVVPGSLTASKIRCRTQNPSSTVDFDFVVNGSAVNGSDVTCDATGIDVTPAGTTALSAGQWGEVCVVRTAGVPGAVHFSLEAN